MVHRDCVHHGVDAGQRGKLKRVAVALYTPEPSAAECKQWGLTIDEARGPDVLVWDDNVPAVRTFIALMTQWRMGPEGPSGIDYSVLPTVFRLAAIPRKEWTEVFAGIQTMEEVALKMMRRK